MKLKELADTKFLIALTNEEHTLLSKFEESRIDIEMLSEREKRVAYNLIIKDVLCKLSDNQLMVNDYVPSTIRTLD
jgi:hypothetical protein